MMAVQTGVGSRHLLGNGGAKQPLKRKGWRDVGGADVAFTWGWESRAWPLSGSSGLLVRQVGTPAESFSVASAVKCVSVRKVHPGQELVLSKWPVWHCRSHAGPRLAGARGSLTGTKSWQCCGSARRDLPLVRSAVASEETARPHRKTL